MLRPIQTVLLIQVLQSSSSGILGIALPIMMKDRQINVVTVGFVFAAMPIIFQLGRMFFATLSDFWGRRLFFVSNGILAVTSGLIYYVARTPLEYLFGKVVEGTKEGHSVGGQPCLSAGARRWTIESFGAPSNLRLCRVRRWELLCRVSDRVDTV